MEQVYALGVICIQYVQEYLAGHGNFFELVNTLSNPFYALEFIFPLVSILDSVFASQFLLCMAFGQWLNAVMKWWLLEERPYWWVQETTFYRPHARPHLHQTSQTCETGPGCPSGHSCTVAMQLMLYIMWISHIMNDRNCYVWWWKMVVYPLCAAALFSVMLARMFVAAHFPHQCLLGAAVGLFLAPALCIYVSDPFIWGPDGRLRRDMFWHVVSAISTIAIAALTYWSLKLCGIDPQWSIKLAFKRCENPHSIHVSSTPMFALVQATACILGWALCVTPAVSKYRHYTTRRSIIIATASAFIIGYILREIQAGIPKDSVWLYYAGQFLIHLVKPCLFITGLPWLARFPYQTNRLEIKKSS